MKEKREREKTKAVERYIEIERMKEKDTKRGRERMKAIERKKMIEREKYRMKK